MASTRQSRIRGVRPIRKRPPASQGNRAGIVLQVGSSAGSIARADYLMGAMSRRPGYDSRMRYLWLPLLLVGCSTTELPPLDVRPELAVQPLGSLAIPLGPAVAVTLAGPLAIVGCGDAGFAVIDISRPEAPALISSRSDVHAHDVACGPDRLCCVGASRRLGAAECVTYDLLDPLEPLELRRDALGSGQPRVAAEGSWSVVAADTIGIDRGNNRLEPVTGLLAGKTINGVLLHRRLLFAVGHQDALFGADGPLQLIIHDPERDATVAELELALTPIDPPTGACLAMCNDRLLIAGREQLVVIDTTEPTAPRPTATLPIAGITAIAGDQDLAALVRDGRVYLLELGDAGAPRIVAQLPAAEPAQAVALLDGLVALVCGSDGLRLFEVTRPAARE